MTKTSKPKSLKSITDFYSEILTNLDVDKSNQPAPERCKKIGYKKFDTANRSSMTYTCIINAFTHSQKHRHEHVHPYPHTQARRCTNTLIIIYIYIYSTRTDMNTHKHKHRGTHAHIHIHAHTHTHTHITPYSHKINDIRFFVTVWYSYCGRNFRYMMNSLRSIQYHTHNFIDLIDFDHHRMLKILKVIKRTNLLIYFVSDFFSFIFLSHFVAARQVHLR